MITRFRRKPKHAERYVMHAARYEPGQPLSDMEDVARLANMTGLDEAELDEVTTFTGGPVVLVRYWRTHDEHPASLEWLVVQQGEWLTWSEEYDFLSVSDDRNLEQFYEQVPP